MGEQESQRAKEQICAGLLAHVDAGKTTLAEAILYHSGVLRELGRVDHRDAFLDTDELERARGITIFSKQAEFHLGEIAFHLLDTPGHVDFSAEMERTLQVLDYAILVISGSDGVQSHTETLWRLLKRYEVPVFLFINKMDQEGTDGAVILRELQTRLDENCISFMADQEDDFFERLAVCEESVLETYLETGQIGNGDIRTLIRERNVFPCYFGSALRMEGVDLLLNGLEEYTQVPQYQEVFGARVFKIARDEQGSRLTYLKVTGGSLKVKDIVKSQNAGGDEKINQIRIYSGGSYQAVPVVTAGCVCAVTGLSATRAGDGVGMEPSAELPLLEPVLTYQIVVPEESDVHRTFLMLRQLEEEIPELHLLWQKETNEIHAQVMGEVQIEILKIMIRERFGLAVEFGSGGIVYKETIGKTVIGVGHFEPLRHYAEVHLLLEPAEPGSGMQFALSCSEDVLERNWQRLILSHLEEKSHKGVLTGAEITDIKITLLTGKAHAKHTEGGDFRQATYRAIRQGLMQADGILLEPVYDFRLELPLDKIGRAMSDIQSRHGRFEPPETAGATAVLTGSVPVGAFHGYHTEVISYTGGMGRLSCSLKGYEPCHNAEEVVTSIGYDAELDVENPAGSVFCAHGAGFIVPWYQVGEYQHLESGIARAKEQPQELRMPTGIPGRSASSSTVSQEELDEIFTRTYGAPKREAKRFKRTVSSYPDIGRTTGKQKEKSAKEYLLVDGYNIIFAWDELSELAKVNIEGARTLLMDLLCNYQGYKKMTLILVFDAYKVAGGVGSAYEYHNIHVVFTKEAETADQYIEKTVHEIGRKYQVTVATSDALEQVIILGQGAARMSARELREEVESVGKEIREEYLSKTTPGGKNYLFQNLDEDLAKLMEDVRLGKRSLEPEDKKKE